MASCPAAAALLFVSLLGAATRAGAQDAFPSSLVVTAADVAALARPVDDASGHALDAFYDALVATAHGGAAVHVVHIGDSNIAFDGITQTLRERFQRRFGDAGHGFVLVAHGPLPYGHRGIDVHTRGGWRIAPLVHGALRDGRYGLGGVLQTSGLGASATLATVAPSRCDVGGSASRFSVLYQCFPRGGTLELRADPSTNHGQDGGPRQEIDTRSTEVRDDVATLTVPDGAHRFALRHVGHGELRVYGAVLERDTPGVVWDSIGIVGARARRLLAFDAEHLAAQIALRAPSLLVIAFGANEASDRWPGDDAFDAQFADVLTRLRAGQPAASCLVVGPADQAPAGRGARTFPSLLRVVASERRVAERTGCAFFDTFTAMGGEGSVSRWSRRGLAAGDHRHLSARGYATVATLIEAALLAGLRDRHAAVSSPVVAPPPAAPR